MEEKEIKLNELECFFVAFVAFATLKVLEKLKEQEEQRRIKKDEDIKKIDS